MTLTRRDILKGLTLGAGSVVLAPVLAQLKAHADGAPAPNALSSCCKAMVFIRPKRSASNPSPKAKGR